MHAQPHLGRKVGAVRVALEGDDKAQRKADGRERQRLPPLQVITTDDGPSSSLSPTVQPPQYSDHDLAELQLVQDDNIPFETTPLTEEDTQSQIEISSSPVTALFNDLNDVQ